MNYEMFTDEGNAAVAAIVELAKMQKLSWPETFQKLRELRSSNPKMYGEVMDTAVREAVYVAIGAYEREEEFFV